ncbi:Selenocysteine lyase/Cysteine desulfurase [Roseateles sp. YR242]|uniref:aminotransferase class V-fold PLP-dependent enzyme n=1 Tax=Roseateles sp. YR242 TaxID=1855305 RepID=UPI0008CF70A8|nr:aminotransferase class V-fold PLP-dependent enzyme [Roseateles sp. YR242]SEK93547.1 Selenocysteine lyase/Cysteine desulfurase [Roseateles sp. YR242]
MDDLRFRVPQFHEALASLPPTPTTFTADDESYWSAVRRLYAVSNQPVNLENGFWGTMAEPVKAMFHHWIDRVNHENTLLIRPHWPQLLQGLRRTVADALGCGEDEIELTRGASEAMQALIGGYNRLQPGDEVMYADLDYPAMRDAMQWLRVRRGAVPVEISIPEPATRQAVLDTYAQALRQHPRTRLVLLSHVCFGTGLVMPVREIGALAKAAGADVIVDAAHSWGQMDFSIADLDVPYAAFNLHKWIGAPLGCACLYVRRDALGAIDPFMGDQTYPADDIRSRVHVGTPNFAAWLTIPSALELHQRIGARQKALRLRKLRDAWVGPAREMAGIDIQTPDDPTMVAGISSFRLRGHESSQACKAIVATLRDVHGVHTVHRDGAAKGSVVRVTPAVTTSLEDIERLLTGLRALQGAPAALAT